jgi:hypothetical protein
VFVSQLLRNSQHLFIHVQSQFEAYLVLDSLFFCQLLRSLPLHDAQGGPRVSDKQV